MIKLPLILQNGNNETTILCNHTELLALFL